MQLPGQFKFSQFFLTATKGKHPVLTYKPRLAVAL